MIGADNQAYRLTLLRNPEMTSLKNMTIANTPFPAAVLLSLIPITAEVVRTVEESILGVGCKKHSIAYGTIKAIYCALDEQPVPWAKVELQVDELIPSINAFFKACGYKTALPPVCEEVRAKVLQDAADLALGEAIYAEEAEVGPLYCYDKKDLVPPFTGVYRMCNLDADESDGMEDLPATVVEAIAEAYTKH
jgi:hypothetical protein